MTYLKVRQTSLNLQETFNERIKFRAVVSEVASFVENSI